jgi:periplasmic nitrate reductase NapE
VALGKVLGDLAEAVSRRCKTRGWSMDEDVMAPTKAQELRAFLLLSVILAPVLAFAVVAGYGFLVWMFQLVAGPPGAKF